MSFPPRFWKESNKYDQTLFEVYTGHSIIRPNQTTQDIGEFVWFTSQSKHLQEEERDLLLVALKDYSWIDDELDLQRFVEYVEETCAEDIVNLHRFLDDFQDYYAIQQVCDDLSGEYIDGIPVVGEYTYIKRAIA